MLRLATHLHRIAAPAGEGLGERPARIEALAALVEGHHLHRGANLHGTRIGREPARQQVDQRGLPRPVRPDDTDPVAAGDADREIAHDRPLAIGLADPLGLDDDLAGGFGLGRGELDIPGGAALFTQFLAQTVQFTKPAHIALAPGRDAVAQPVLLRRDLAGELVPVALFFLQHLVTPGLEGAEAFLQPPRLAAIEPDRGAGEFLQKTPVVADQDERGAHARELALEPFDRRQVEVVGRLVEQQNIG